MNTEYLMIFHKHAIWYIFMSLLYHFNRIMLCIEHLDAIISCP